MIEKFSDLGLDALKGLKGVEFFKKLDELLTEKLGLSLENIVQPLSQYMIAHAEELALELPNIVPFGKYDKVLESNDEMADFLKKEAAETKNWMIHSLSDDDKFEHLVRFVFENEAVDDGTTIRGTTFVSKSGIVRHSFVQAIT